MTVPAPRTEADRDAGAHPGTALSPSAFAVQATEADIQLLVASRASQHLLVLRALLDGLRSAGADRSRAAFDDSFETLADMQRHRPDVVGALIADPLTNAWSAHCLRMVRGLILPSQPLHVDLAHLGAITASAARAAGRTLTVRVPVRSGRLFLPGVGRVRVPAEAQHVGGTVDIAVDGDRVLLAGRALVDWERLRRVRAAVDDRVLDVVIDDMSPYRHRLGAVADRLDPSTHAAWARVIGDGWRTLVTWCPSWAGPLRHLITAVAPFASSSGSSRSATMRDAVGVFGLDRPVDGAQFVATMVHEAQHSRLYALHDLAPLYRHTAERMYSPWRRDARPLSGVLHGAFAFSGVADVWRRLRSRPGHLAAEAELQFAIAVRQVADAHETLLGFGDRLTAAGHLVVEDVGRHLALWSAEPVAAPIASQADTIVSEHRERWASPAG